jgi:myo-inositol-1(or 4)-monophosphatase
MQLNILENLEFAKSIAISAGKIALDYQSKGFKISHKQVISNLVTEADIACEKHIIENLKTKFPDFSILAEESGLSDNPTNSEYQWVIDPIDGTTNYAHGYPYFAISIALKHKDQILLGVTHAPMLNETFTAAYQHGAFLNGKKIQVSTNPSLELSLLATGFPPNKGSNDFSKAIALFTKAQNFIHGVRRSGSACLDLAYAACGRLDGFFEIGLKPWDTAVGTLLISEAGGKVTNFDGKPFTLDQNNIIATNSIIHQELRDYLN